MLILQNCKLMSRFCHCQRTLCCFIIAVFFFFIIIIIVIFMAVYDYVAMESVSLGKCLLKSKLSHQNVINVYRATNSCRSDENLSVLSFYQIFNLQSAFCRLTEFTYLSHVPGCVRPIVERLLVSVRHISSGGCHASSLLTIGVIG